MEANNVFLGTLRSDLDTPDVLPECFSALASAADTIIERYRTGKLDPAATAALLAELKLSDHESFLWTVGATTRRWYRKVPGGVWRAALPPSSVDPSTDAAAAEMLSRVSQLSAQLASDRLG